MRTINILFLAITLPCFGNGTNLDFERSESTSAACRFVPLSTATEGERIRISWTSPMCEVADVRIYRRRQHIGQEELIHPVVIRGQQAEAIVVTCWDSAFTELNIYEYRLVPIDSAGSAGPSSRWTTAHNLHQEAQPWLHSLNASSVPEKRAIQLSWHLENAPRARSLVIHRADHYDGPYDRLTDLVPTDTTFTDHVQRVKETYFYRLEVIDVVGRSTMTMPIQGLSDMTPKVPPPAMPFAQAITSGVRLTWQQGGPDVAHYQVEREELGDEEYVLIAADVQADQSAAIQWTDTSASNNAVLRYRVRAVSIGGILSDPSEAVEVQALDQRVPTVPTEIAVRWSGPKQAVISWRDPWAGEPGAFHAVVQRADIGRDEFIPLNGRPLDPGQTLFIDSTALDDRSYQYRVVGLSLDGRQGMPSLPAELAANRSAQKGPRMLAARSTDQGIQIEWAKAARAGTGLNIYRSVDDGAAELVRFLPPDAGGYLDEVERRNALHTYVVRLVLSDGSESIPSEPVSIRY